MDKSEAIKAANNGAIAALISGVITIVIVAIAILSNSHGTLSIWNDPTNLIDIILIFACAFGLWKKSRTAAVVLLVYFILSKIIIGIELDRPAGLILSLIFIYYFAKAVHGTFVFHKIEKDENPEYKSTSHIYYFTGIPIGVIFLLLMVLGILTMTSVLPSTKVVAGSKVYDSDRKLLISKNVISNEDTIKYFYSEGLTSVLEAGSILTDQKVIAYVTDENNKMLIYEIYFKEISSVDLVEKGDFVDPSVYIVKTPYKDKWLKLFLSTEADGDMKFVEELKKMAKKAISANKRQLQ